MPLTPGTRLGPFEILAPLGAGGMGEVHRARDTRLARDVAIKSLPDGFARDAERLARFEREARLLASLSHPNVAGILGVEEVEGHRYLVLELVEGESLAARLARGPLPVEEAIEVCRQVAAGVEAAHEAGIVHRDLKPGNVMLAASGAVKVLDFGLAKSGGIGNTPSQDPSLSASPTMTFAATTAGVILGTAAYMSPEQARGRAVDKRSDVWSFGCLLYECLTGRQAFHGETGSDAIAAILKTEADMGALPAGTPLRVRELLARCLCKDPRERLRDIGEARVLLGGIRANDVAPANDGPAVRGVPPRFAIGGALAVAALAVALTIVLAPKPAPARLRVLDLVADDIGADWFFAPQLSPDGTAIAYVAKGQVWVRDLAQLEPRHLADAEGMTTCCWSPDSRQLAFVEKKKLWRVPVSGGTPSSLCEVPGTGASIGLTWAANGTIAFSAWRGGIYTVPATGGNPVLLVDIDPTMVVDFHAPCWLPNGELMFIVHWSDKRDSAGGHPHDLEVFADGRRIPVGGGFGDESQVTGVVDGKLLFVRRGASAGIWEVGYDARARRTRGVPRLVTADAVSVSAAKEGSLLYMEGGDRDVPIELDWVDRTGRLVGSTGPARPGLSGARLSPDGKRAAFAAEQDDQTDIWVRDLARGTDSRITFTKEAESAPVWLGPDRLAYSAQDHVGGMEARLLRVNADGSGGRGVLAPPAGTSTQTVEIAAGTAQALRTIDDRGHGRLRLSPLLPDGSLGPPDAFARFTPEPSVETAALSPDGRLVAYATDDVQPEVFLTRFPSGEGQWQASSEGGMRPRWAAAAQALYYVAGGTGRRWMAEAKIDRGHDPPIGTTTRLFDLDAGWLGNRTNYSFDVSPDGRRFLMSRPAPRAAGRPTRMVLVQNWPMLLAK